MSCASVAAQRTVVRAAWMEKSMSKPSTLGHSANDHRALEDTELDLVTGGMLFLNPSPSTSMSMAEICLEAVKVGLTDCINTLGSLGAPPKA